MRQIRSDLADRAERTTFGDGKNATVSCPDPQLQMALRGVVKAIDQLPELQKPEVAAVEGSEATIEAFRRLTTSFYGLLSFKMPPSAEELRELQKKAVQSVENPPNAEVRASRAFDGEAAGLSKRDYVPLAVAVFVDLCLFLVSMAQRPANRLDGLVPKMKAAERGPVIEILSRFNDIHRDQQIRENFELFRHVVFDMNGDYYVAVPLDAPPRMNPTEREELRVEAQLLANLFASFEREKIFKRTMLPTTGSIQKRLGRQGSKFAGSELFRVYKFAQGAWSDIILGAVMGAARRAEAEEDGVRNTRGPDLPKPAARVLPDAPVPKPETPAPNFERHAASSAPTQSIDPQHAMRFGPYAETYRPDPASPPYYAPPRTRRTPAAQPEADATVKAANSNTARTAPDRAAAVPQYDRDRRPDAESATLRAGQRRHEFSISSRSGDGARHVAARDGDFHCAGQRSRHPRLTQSGVGWRRSELGERCQAPASGDVIDVPPVREPAPAGHEPPPRLPEDQLSAEDRAFIRRIAPPAAE